jgi:hypothetical protein
VCTSCECRAMDVWAGPLQFSGCAKVCCGMWRSKPVHQVSWHAYEVVALWFAMVRTAWHPQGTHQNYVGAAGVGRSIFTAVWFTVILGILYHHSLSDHGIGIKPRSKCAIPLNCVPKNLLASLPTSIHSIRESVRCP